MKFLITLVATVLLLTNLHASNEDSLAQCYAAFLTELKQGKMTKDEMKFLEKVTRGIQMYELILAEAKNKGDMEKTSETIKVIKKYSAILKDIYNSTEPPVLYRMKKCLPNVMKNLVTSGVGATSLEIIFDYKKLKKNKQKLSGGRKTKSSILQNF